MGDKSNVTDVTKTDMEEAIIEQIKRNHKVTVDQLAEKLQANRRIILRCLTLMKQDGTIEPVGSIRNVLEYIKKSSKENERRYAALQ